MGDWFQHNDPRFELILWTSKFFNHASQLFEKIYIIPGNHDYRSDGYATDFIMELKAPNLVYITPDSPEFTFELIPNELYGTFLPYFDTEKTGVTYYDFIKTRKKDIPRDKHVLFAHLYDEKAIIGSEGKIMTKVVKEIDFYEFEKDFISVISGHIHTYQEYNYKSMKVIYPGTCQNFTKHDLNSQKHYMKIAKGFEYSYSETDHTFFIHRELKDPQVDIFTDLSPNKFYLIYLTVTNPLLTDTEYHRWCLDTQKLHPNILYIYDTYSEITAESMSFDILQEKDTSGTFPEFLLKTLQETDGIEPDKKNRLVLELNLILKRKKK